jgi:hypothetical protein
MLLQNAFTALGKSEIREGLKAAGVEVFDAQGKMRGLMPIVEELSGVMASMSDQEKSNFLEKIGLRDAQAKQAFSVLTDETGKLQEAMNATANATGEMQAALDQSNTPMNKIKGIWTDIQYTALGLYAVIETVLNPVLVILGGLFSGIAWVVESVGNAWSWWTSKLQEGNPWIVGLTTLLGGLAAVLAINWAWSKKDAIWTGIVTAAKWVQSTAVAVLTGATWAQVAAQWGLNTAMLASPITWIVVGIAALIACVIAAWRHFEKFRATITGVWEVLKGLGTIIKDFIIDRIMGILSGLGSLASAFKKLVKLDFSGAKEDAKKGFADLSGASAMKNAIDSGKQLGDKFKQGYATGIENFQNAKDKNNKKPGIEAPTVEMPAMPGSPDMGNFNYDDLMSKFEKDKKKKGSKGKADKADKLALGVPQDYNQSNAYSAITSKFGAQVDLAMKAPSNSPQGGENPTTKPVINMATRVDEIAGSLRKIAATAALPVALTLAAGNARAMQPLNAPSADEALSRTTQMAYSAPVNNLANTANYANYANTTENNLFSNVATTANNYNESTLAINNDNSTASYQTTNNNQSTANNGKTIKIDRFTDKIEIHVHGGSGAPEEAAQRVRDEVEKALAEIFNV